MLKKILKWTGITLVVLLIVLFTAPFIFKDKIKEMVAKTINENLDATVAFEDVDLSLFRQFPQADVKITKLSIINKAPFVGDTLFYTDDLNLRMSVKELFKGSDEGMEIQSFSAANSVVNILFNKDGIGNFDIALKNKEEEQPSGEPSSPMKLKIQDYKIDNLKFRFADEKSKINMVIDSLQHQGKGDFTNNILDLDTKSKAIVSFKMDEMQYITNVALTLDAVLGIDLDQMKFTFKENKALINQLPLEFDGYLQMLENGQRYDLKFKTPESGFQNFLALIPSAYSGSLKDVKTTGDFKVEGFAKGDLTDTTIPKFDLLLASNNASFQYPDLPKSVQNIVIDAHVKNETGIMNDTYVNLDKLSFKIDQDVFNASANIKNLAENAHVNGKVNGTINLGNLNKAYPIQLDVPLSGILKADLAANFDMKAIEESAYERVDGSGVASISGFNYTDNESKKTYQIQTADLAFNKSKINLKDFAAKTGKTDLRINGTLENFLGFMLKNQTLKGNFNLNSNQFAVADFMTETPVATPKTTTESKPATDKKAATTEAIKIPAFLDCTLSAKANTVLYDNLTLKNVSGKIILKDQKARLENVRTDAFGGAIALTGDVSTKEATPTFNIDLDMSKVDIQQTFTQLEMMKSIAPIAGVLNGKINTKIKVNGKLDAKEMTPVLSSISGDVLGELLSTVVNDKTSPMLTKLDQNLKFVDLNKINLNDLKAALNFSNGRVNLKPFTLKYQDIKINIDGSHGFDQTMGYNVNFDVPAKYLGSEAGNLLAKLSATEIDKLGNIPVKAILSGNFNDPKVSTDLKASMTALTNKIIASQKDNLVKQGTSALNNILSGNKPNDNSTNTPPQTKADSVKQQQKDKVKEATKGVLDLLKKK